MTLFVGIDWSDESLEYHARSAEGRELAEGHEKPDLAGMGELFTVLEQHAPPSEIHVAIETAHGAWAQALLDRGYTVYPVNPKSAERFREALSAAGNKSDRFGRTRPRSWPCASPARIACDWSRSGPPS